LAKDLAALQSLAQDIVKYVELKVDEEGTGRVLLHLAHPLEIDTLSSKVNSANGERETSDGSYSKFGEDGFPLYRDQMSYSQDSIRSETTLDEMLLEGFVFQLYRIISADLLLLLF
jgi:hypothetical protein